jgi:hypothetical protein
MGPVGSLAYCLAKKGTLKFDACQTRRETKKSHLAAIANSNVNHIQPDQVGGATVPNQDDIKSALTFNNQVWILTPPPGFNTNKCKLKSPEPSLVDFLKTP